VPVLLVVELVLQLPDYLVLLLHLVVHHFESRLDLLLNNR
jgi:hypothetical protein